MVFYEYFWLLSAVAIVSHSESYKKRGWISHCTISKCEPFHIIAIHPQNVGDTIMAIVGTDTGTTKGVKPNGDWTRGAGQFRQRTARKPQEVEAQEVGKTLLARTVFNF